MIGIYKITNPKGKVYIGQSVEIEERWKYHKYTIDREQINTPLVNSLRKYGADRHTFEVVEECKRDQLNIRERHWQEYYNVLSEGLNAILVETDSNPQIISKEQKDKISDSVRRWHKEVGHSLDTKRKMSNSHQGVKREPCSEEKKNKISTSLAEYWSNGGLSNDSRRKISETLKNKETFICDKCGFTYKESQRKRHTNSTMCDKRAKKTYCVWKRI